MVAGDEDEEVEEEASGSGPSASGDNKSEPPSRPCDCPVPCRPSGNLAFSSHDRNTLDDGRSRTDATALRQLFALPAEMRVGGRNAYSVG